MESSEVINRLLNIAQRIDATYYAHYETDIEKALEDLYNLIEDMLRNKYDNESKV